jgi:hypothetical protein
MGGMLANFAGFLVRVQSLASAVVLSAFFSLFFRSFLLLLFDRGRGAVVVTARVLSGWIFLTLGWLYALFVAHSLIWDAATIGMVVATAVLVHAGFAYRQLTDRKGDAPGPIALLLQVVLLLSLLLVATLTLMREGFLSLTIDQTVLLVDVTGETSSQRVRWAPPNQDVREEDLMTHRVVFRTPNGVPVGETWVYGDQVAVKGRVLRLSPVLNAAGISNLFELLFAHNGYATADRHNTYPHTAVPLPPTGPLAVHPWWRPLQVRLLEKWEKRSVEGSSWTVRSVTTESTYYPLVGADAKPVRQTFRLVLTPGGLSAS